MQSLIIVSLLLMVLVPTLMLLVRRHRKHTESDELSPITRQHIDLFQGGQLSESAVESVNAGVMPFAEPGGEVVLRGNGTQLASCS